MARTKVAGGQLREGAAATPSTASQAAIPFDQASKPEIEPGPSWLEQQLGASAQTLGPIALPANGFIRAILIDVETTTNGTIGTGEASEDFPFNTFEQIRLTEPNGAPLGLELTGWHTLLADVYGGYAGSPDPRNDPDYSAEAIKPSFTLRLPVEIAPNGLGALGNQSASAALRLTLTLAPSTVAYAKALTTNPKFAVRTYIELWGEPPKQDMFGRPCAQRPPFEGTAQYWSEQTAQKVSTANNTIRLTRVGSQIRTLIFEFVESGGAAGKRTDGACPDPFEIQLDNRIFRQYSRRMIRKIMRECVESLTKRDTGVYAISSSTGEGRHVGENAYNSWLTTLTATRLEVRGPAGSAGEMNVLTNDVSVTAVNPAERTQQVNAGAYHPPVGETSFVTG